LLPGSKDRRAVSDRVDDAHDFVPGNHRLARFAGATGCPAGDWVGLGFLGGHCGVCVWCRHGDFVNCENRPRTGKTVDGGYAEVVVQPRRGSYRCRLRRGWSCMRRSAVMPVGLIAGVVRAVVGVDQHRCCAERGIEWRASGLALFGHSA